MNASFDRHFSEEILEEYTLGMQSEEDCTPLEEHLLICPACQDLLAEADEYIGIVKAATGAAGTQRRWSKPVGSAVTLVFALLLFVVR